MKVLMLSSIAGPSWSCRPGKTYDFPEAEAKRLINAGIAKAIEAPKPVEAAILEPPAKQVLQRAKPRKIRR